jgi:hypothetical protein
MEETGNKFFQSLFFPGYHSGLLLKGVQSDLERFFEIGLGFPPQELPDLCYGRLAADDVLVAFAVIVLVGDLDDFRVDSVIMVIRVFLEELPERLGQFLDRSLILGAADGEDLAIRRPSPVFNNGHEGIDAVFHLREAAFLEAAVHQTDGLPLQ